VANVVIPARVVVPVVVEDVMVLARIHAVRIIVPPVAMYNVMPKGVLLIVLVVLVVVVAHVLVDVVMDALLLVNVCVQTGVNPHVEVQLVLVLVERALIKGRHGYD